MLLFSLFLYIVSFFTIWLGTGFIIDSIEKYSKKLRVNSFFVSYFILGLLTSIPEMAVGVTALKRNEPEVFIGNLLGGVIVIFLLIIPILAILGKEIKLSRQLNKYALLFSLFIVALPSLVIADKIVTDIEAITLIFVYFLSLILIQKNSGMLEKIKNKMTNGKKRSFKDFLKFIIGVILVYISSQLIVDKTLFFATLLKTSPFLISLIMISIGTNIPELSLAIRSILKNKKDIAFGDYMGSAAANTMLFGLLSYFNSGDVITNSRFFITFIFIFVGLSFFFYFSRSKANINRNEGLVLLSIYIIFLLVEILK